MQSLRLINLRSHSEADITLAREARDSGANPDGNTILTRVKESAYSSPPWKRGITEGSTQTLDHLPRLLKCPVAVRSAESKPKVLLTRGEISITAGC